MIEWDRTHDFEIHRVFVEQTEATVHFAANTPSIAEIVAMRQLVPHYSTMPPATLREFFGESGWHTLGEMNGYEVRVFERKASKLGLHVTIKNTSYVHSYPFDKTTGRSWIIEDPDELIAVVESMIAAGIPISIIEG